jgi:hypothetical protein
MPYIFRDDTGKVSRASVRPLVGGECVPHNHPDVVGFLKARQQDPKEVADALAELQVTDMEMSRAIEDLVMVLLKKNVIKMMDLPRQVQDRMAYRVRLRVRIEETYEKASRLPVESQPAAFNGAAITDIALTSNAGLAHA